MTLKHLNFEELSNLIDNELPEHEKEYYLSHITACEICGREYDSLCKCISLLSALKNECMVIPDFSERTIMICRSREKKRLFLKAVPAIAASVIIIAGAGFIRTGIFDNQGSYVAANLSGYTETQKIIDSVSKTNGRIIKITHSYIDSEFDKRSVSAIKRLLQQNNIKHAIIVNSGMLINPATGGMENVSLSMNSATISNNAVNSQGIGSIENGKIRMRIFK